MSSNEQMVTRTQHHGEIPARLIGMMVFFIGIGMLLLIFKIAYGLFTASPATALGLNITGDPKHDPAAMLIGQSFGWLMIKILLLFLMSVVASLTAQKGVNMYFSGVHGGRTHEVTKPASSASAEA